MEIRSRVGCYRARNLTDPEGDLFSPISEYVRALAEAGVAERAKCGVVEALGARNIANADRDVIKHRSLLKAPSQARGGRYLGARFWSMLGKNC